MNTSATTADAQQQSVEQLVQHVTEQTARVIVGQREMVRQCLAALLVNGHALLEGVPGVAKTLAVKTIARLLDLRFQRVQCTSDLMPSDIIGTNVLQQQTSSFQLHRGPIFGDLLLVDEINRMPPRTQAALLEAMEERQVTVDGVCHPLNPSFAVFATQNPVEFEGTYPLPEAQLDRFLLKCLVDYPAELEEVQILRAHNDSSVAGIAALDLASVPAGLFPAASAFVKTVRVDETLISYVSRITRATRTAGQLVLGASPRASVSLLLVSKAFAAMDGRDYVIPDDIKDATLPVLRHRVILTPEAQLEGVTSDHVLQQVLKSVELPK